MFPPRTRRSFPSNDLKNQLYKNPTHISIHFPSTHVADHDKLTPEEFTSIICKHQNSKKCKYLNVQGNKIDQSIPVSVAHSLPALETFILKNNKFKSWTTVFNQFTSLTHLDLSFNQISSMKIVIQEKEDSNTESWISSFSNMWRNEDKKVVNHGKSGTKQENLFKTLLNLNLSHNRLKRFPMDVLLFANLNSLDLSYNNLAKIPKEIGQLKYLKELKLRNCSLQEFPSTIVSLNGLRVLDLSENGFRCIPPPSSGNVLFPFLEVLALSDCGLIEVPEFLFGNHLKELELMKNQLTNVDKIAQFVSLEVLNLQKNQISQVQILLNSLVNLRELVLSSNLLISKEMNFERLTNLETLRLNSCSLQHFPNGLETLTKLKRLSLLKNEIHEIPDSVYSLTSLEELHLSGNNISTLSENVSKLTALNSLALCHNKLSELPKSLMNLKSVKQILISFNPVRIEVEHFRGWCKKHGTIISQSFADIDKVIDKLYIGGIAVAKNRHLLKRLGITHVLGVAHGLEPIFPKVQTI